MKNITLTGNTLTLEDLVEVSRHKARVELSQEARQNVITSRAIVEDIVAKDKVVYGITTGFGEFSKVKICQEDCAQLQENLIRSHACGYGMYFTTDIVRAVMLTRANALSKGYSGIKLETLETLIAMLNKEVHPLIPEKGSLGASGDLAPLSHMVLPMLGLGEAEYQGLHMSGKEAMDKAGIPIIKLDAKEGLALINGTQVLTSTGALAVYDAEALIKLSDITAALTMEALRGITDAFDPRIHIIRNQRGQIVTAKNMLRLLEGSTYTTRQGELRVQDAYSLRCIPQVHGASKDTVAYVKSIVELELNAVTDNPIVTREGDIISGGNFHGEPMAVVFDFLGIGAAEIASISERRLERLINPQLNDLPAFLTTDGGISSGFMITQYAAAALVSENKILAHPASVDSIPSSANQEDIVSMGTIAARTARDIIDNVKRVITTELMAACQAIDFRANDGFKLGVGTQPAYDVIRREIKFMERDNDIEMYKELDKITALITSREILETVEKAVKLDC